MGVGTTALSAKLVGLILRILQIPSHGGQVGGHCIHVLGVGAVVEVAERELEVFFDALAEDVVGVGDGLDGVNDSIPWGLKDAMDC